MGEREVLLNFLPLFYNLTVEANIITASFLSILDAGIV